MSIFGLSMLDLYGLTIFSALFTEITHIIGNIVNYLTNTHFYQTLIGLLGYKTETPTKMESMNRTDSGSTKLPKEIEGKSKISD
jgi:hypothetical protein